MIEESIPDISKYRQEAHICFKILIRQEGGKMFVPNTATDSKVTVDPVSANSLYSAEKLTVKAYRDECCHIIKSCLPVYRSGSTFLIIGYIGLPEIRVKVT